jgi:plasmid stabilization system protein ParE
MEVIITDSAQEDLDAIFDFIAKDSDYYAHLVISEIKQWCFIQLGLTPKIWRIKNDEIRQTVWPYKYTIRYQIQDDAVFVIMVYKNYT